MRRRISRGARQDELDGVAMIFALVGAAGLQPSPPGPIVWSGASTRLRERGCLTSQWVDRSAVPAGTGRASRRVFRTGVT
jgi:hypothetical protein